MNEKTHKIAYAESTMFTAELANNKTERFSAKFGGDVLFSAEKVWVNAYAANNKFKSVGGVSEDNQVIIRYNTYSYKYNSTSMKYEPNVTNIIDTTSHQTG